MVILQLLLSSISGNSSPEPIEPLWESTIATFGFSGSIAAILLLLSQGRILVPQGLPLRSFPRPSRWPQVEPHTSTPGLLGGFRWELHTQTHWPTSNSRPSKGVSDFIFELTPNKPHNFFPLGNIQPGNEMPPDFQDATPLQIQKVPRWKNGCSHLTWGEFCSLSWWILV